MPPSSVESCPLKSPTAGDAGESGIEAAESESRTAEAVSEKPLEDKCSSDSPSSSSNSRSQPDVLKPPGDEPLLVSISADSNIISETTEIPSAEENCISTKLSTSSSHPEVNDKTYNTRKRKRESKTKHMIHQNGSVDTR